FHTRRWRNRREGRQKEFQSCVFVQSTEGAALPPRPQVRGFRAGDVMTSSHRIEHDSMGELKVPADALWGAQTQRAVQNFPVSGLTMPRAFIGAVGLIKQAAARANTRLELLDAGISRAIDAAAAEVAAGQHDAQFPIDVFQTGSGTSTNMNANEVVATL